MPSRFYLQIVDKDTGEIVSSWEPGSRAETDVLAELSVRLSGRGVGWGRTTKHVMADLSHAWHALLHDLKSQVLPK
jgi:hypothetical protein